MAKYNLFDAASLVTIPTGVKDGKLYSIKPEDGSGDFTFSRDGAGASPATRVNSQGLIEKGRENVLLQSNSFSTSPWTLDGAIITSGQTGYDGSSDAWKLESSGGSFPRVQQTLSQSNVQTFSVYAKAGEVDHLRVLAITGLNPDFRFDLTNGTIANKTGIDKISGKITSVGNGWYRCEVSFNGTGTSYRFYPMQDASNFAADGEGLYIQDAQLEAGLVATDYIETTTAPVSAGLLGDTPRLDYSNGATCPSLLLEPSRTNLITQSEYIGGVFSGTRMDINDVVDTSPEGVVNASKIIPTTDASTHQATTGNIGNFSINDKVTTSVFAKADGYDGIYMRYISSSGAFTANHIAFFDLSRGRWYNSDGLPFDGASGAMSGEVGMEDMGNGWYRCFATATADAAGDLNLMISAVDVTAIDTYNDNFAGDGTSGVLLYGLQVEKGSYPTSYIPTYGSASGRGADSGTASASIPSTNIGSVFIDANFTNPRESGINFFSISTAGSTSVGWKGISTNNPSLQLNGNGTISDSGAINIAEGKHKLLFRWTDGTAEIFVDGIKASTTITDSAAPSYFTSTEFSGLNSTAYSLNQALLFPMALTDAECIALTTL